MGKSTNWYRNILSKAEVKISVGEATFSARAKVPNEKGIQKAIELFTKTYGKKMMGSYYPRKDGAVEVPPPE